MSDFPDDDSVVDDPPADELGAKLTRRRVVGIRQQVDAPCPIDYGQVGNSRAIISEGPDILGNPTNVGDCSLAILCYRRGGPGEPMRPISSSLMVLTPSETRPQYVAADNTDYIVLLCYGGPCALATLEWDFPIV